MAHELPPLKSLRVFDACVRAGSFTKAAGELNVGQPAVSHQIQALERDLGVKLFERRGAQTFPTPAALAYHRAVAAAMADIARASTALRRAAAQPGLTLATYPGIAMFWLMPKLAALRAADSSLRVRVTTAERDRDVRIDDVDCAILFGDGHWPGYESRLLVREAVIPVAAPPVAARFAGRGFAEMLAEGPLIHLEDSDRRWFTWRDWRDARAPDARQIDPGVRVTNHGIAIHQTLIGQGISLGWSG
ncbi:LysR family transcriptional regulator, partial [Amaricoccus solimangrovi]